MEAAGARCSSFDGDRGPAAVSGALRARFAGAAIGVLLLIGTAAAQDVTEPALKAAFIYNFAKFTEWPEALPTAQPWELCVLGDPAVGEALTRVVKGRELAGHALRVSPLTPGEPRRVCHVLYLSGVTARQAAQVVDGLRDQPVLTISDISGFTELGGIAQCYFDQGQLRFSVHRASAARARLQISSRLLLLARLE
ncbi:MAG: YfiR family protein [Acidobacteriota bacterium]